MGGDDSAFTKYTADAPEGDQVLFLQHTGNVQLSITTSAGTYQLSFDAIQRNHKGTDTQVISVRVDGYTPKQIE